MRISIEKNKIIRSLEELEKEFENGKIPKSHYDYQKRQLTEKLETMSVAERVRRLQGKKTEQPIEESGKDDDNEELFKKFITSPGLKEKKIVHKKGITQNTMIATALLIVAFVIGIGFGIYALNIPGEVSSASLYTNDSAFPPFVLNNTTNMTNATNSTTKIIENKTSTASKAVQTTPTTPTKNTQTDTTTKPTKNTQTDTTTTPTKNTKSAAGEPTNNT